VSSPESELTEAQEFGEVVGQLGVSLAELITYAITDSVRNRDKVKNEFYRLGVKFHDWFERSPA
jgi:hypothetical protein